MGCWACVGRRDVLYFLTAQVTLEHLAKAFKLYSQLFLFHKIAHPKVILGQILFVIYNISLKFHIDFVY